MDREEEIRSRGLGDCGALFEADGPVVDPRVSDVESPLLELGPQSLRDLQRDDLLLNAADTDGPRIAAPVPRIDHHRVHRALARGQVRFGDVASRGPPMAVHVDDDAVRVLEGEQTVPLVVFEIENEAGRVQRILTEANALQQSIAELYAVQVAPPHPQPAQIHVQSFGTLRPAIRGQVLHRRPHLHRLRGFHDDPRVIGVGPVAHLDDVAQPVRPLHAEQQDHDEERRRDGGPPPHPSPSARRPATSRARTSSASNGVVRFGSRLRSVFNASASPGRRSAAPPANSPS